MIQINRAELEPVFEALEETFHACNIDYYLIGALARDTWYARGDKKFRTTKDVDFAVMVGSYGEYDSVREYLRKNKGFAESTTNAFVVISNDGIAIDLLPFGSLEIDETVTLKGQGLTSIKVNGFMEVYNDGTKAIEVVEGHIFNVATLPAIVLLKFIAYDDRPEQRTKDARDIANILVHYFDLETDLIYAQHTDLFGENMPDRKLEEIAAMVAGREIRKILGKNASLHQRLKDIIANHIREGDKSTFIRNMAQETNQSIDDMSGLLGNILSGLAGY